MLLLFNNKSPNSVIHTEIESNQNIEGALRRVLGEKNWEVSSGGDSDVNELQKEVLEKDRKIAELNKQLTQSSGNEGASNHGDSGDLLSKISELEARLLEYEIIEDDIADLSLYKTENEKLKEELARLKALAGETMVEPEEPEAEDVVVEEEAEQENEIAQAEEETVAATPPPVVEEKVVEKIQPADLVAEFEKVVNNQSDLEDDSDFGQVDAKEDNQVESNVTTLDSANPGKVMVKEEEDSSKGQVASANGGEDEIHPKLRDVNPDSKEEAEVFISELKSLKKGT